MSATAPARTGDDWRPGPARSPYRRPGIRPRVHVLHTARESWRELFEPVDGPPPGPSVRAPDRRAWSAFRPTAWPYRRGGRSLGRESRTAGRGTRAGCCDRRVPPGAAATCALRLRHGPRVGRRRPPRARAPARRWAPRRTIPVSYTHLRAHE